MAQHYFAQISPGLEGLLKNELKSFGARKIKLEEGGASFQGTRKHLYRILDQSRLANLIYWTVSEGTAPNTHALFERVMKISWKDIIAPADGILRVSIRVSLSRHPEFQGTGEVESIVYRAIERSLKSSRKIRSAHWNEDGVQNHLRVLVRIQDHRVSIRLDAAGCLMHKRGWRQQDGEAPLRPTLAAAMLKLLKWSSNEVLIDPMCGSGTIPIEASLMAAGVSPRLWTHYACHDWLNFDEELWNLETLANFNAEQDNQFHSHIYAFDINPEAVALTQRHLSLSQQMVQVSQADVRQLDVPDRHQSGLILINPPYGLRVSEGEETKSLLRNFAEQREKWQHWRIGMIYPRQLTPPAPQGLVGKELARFQHGGLPVWVWEFSHL